MNIIEFTLFEDGNKVSINKSTVCYVVNEGNMVKIQFIGTHQNFIQVKEKYEDVIKVLF